jgi:hypothetical protein
VRAPSIVILGTDAVAAALPATAIQLVHAATKAGYSLAVPSSWGDELIAAAVLDRLRDPNDPVSSGREPVILSTCPAVDKRIGEGNASLARHMLSFTAPPVATALYLRAAYQPTKVRITYVGRCSAPDAGAIDERLAPDAFLSRLAARGIVLSEQPGYFDSMIPPDRRRFLSLAGGVPAPRWAAEVGRELVELDPEHFGRSLTSELLSGRRTLIDPTPALGCPCTGEGCGVGTPGKARHDLALHEPPRSATPILDEAICLDLAPRVVRADAELTLERGQLREPGPISAVG